MSIPIFSLENFVRGFARRPGQPVIREDEWDYQRERMASGKVVTYSSWTWPVHHWTIDFNFLYDNPSNLFGMNADTDLRMLRGLFNQLGAGLQPFYFEDPIDRSTVGETLGTGDGVTTRFQLIRSMGGFSEPMQSPACVAVAGGAPPAVRDNGAAVASSAFSVDGTGGVVFSAAPAGTHLITADIPQFYFLAQFSDKKVGFEEFLHQVQQMRQVKIESIKQ